MVLASIWVCQSHVSGLAKESMEEIQIANYGIGGQYNPHFDYFIDGKEFKNNRLATWLGYISDVQGGGGTAFPDLGLIVRNKYLSRTDQWYSRWNL